MMAANGTYAEVEMIVALRQVTFFRPTQKKSGGR